MWQNKGRTDRCKPVYTHPSPPPPFFQKRGYNDKFKFYNAYMFPKHIQIIFFITLFKYFLGDNTFV